MIPRLIVQFDVPQKLVDLPARLHNQFAKQSLRETLVEHHKRHTRKHFQVGNARRYGHYPRSAAYRKRKQREKGHDIDQLYSGRSRAAIAGASIKVAVGGAAEGGKKGLSASYRLKYPFTGLGRRDAVDKARQQLRSQGASEQQIKVVERKIRAGQRLAGVFRGRNVGLAEMVRELERWADDEARWATRYFVDKYWQRVKAWQGGRKRFSSRRG